MITKITQVNKRFYLGGYNMYKKILSLPFIFSLLLFPEITFSEELNMKEGLWEITIKMEMEEMPMEMPAHTIKQCIKKENPIPKFEENEKDCKFTMKETKGNIITWVAECKNEEGKIIMKGKITYKGTTFDGVVEVKENDKIIMKEKLSGKWLGECK